MNVLKKYKLKWQQEELMRRYSILENLQTKHSGDMAFFRYIQRELDFLDEETECIRRSLIGGEVNGC